MLPFMQKGGELRVRPKSPVDGARNHGDLSPGLGPNPSASPEWSACAQLDFRTVCICASRHMCFLFTASSIGVDSGYPVPGYHCMLGVTSLQRMRNSTQGAVFKGLQLRSFIHT